MSGTMTAVREIGSALVLPWNAEAFTTVAEARGKQESVLEPKLDGFRLLAQVTDDGTVHLWTRNWNDKAKRAVAIAAEICAQFPPGTWIDGEAVTMTVDDKGRVIMGSNKTSTILGGNPKPLKLQEQLTFIVFDLMAHGGIDARSLPFGSRRQLLERIFDAEGFDRVSLVPQFEAIEETHEVLLMQGFEGSMVKHLRAPYGSGKRGGGQGKVKAKWTLDAFITGAKPGEGSFTGLVGAIVFSQVTEDGTILERGKCSGMDFKTRVWLTENLDELIANRQVVEIKHNGTLPGTDGLRHPQYKGLRSDKVWSDCEVHNG